MVYGRGTPLLNPGLRQPSGGAADLRRGLASGGADGSPSGRRSQSGARLALVGLARMRKSVCLERVLRTCARREAGIACAEPAKGAEL